MFRKRRLASILLPIMVTLGIIIITPLAALDVISEGTMSILWFVIIIIGVIIAGWLLNTYMQEKSRYMDKLVHELKGVNLGKDKQSVNQIRNRNPLKIFVPMSNNYEKLQGFATKYRDRNCWVYVATKVSRPGGGREESDNCLFYEMQLRPIPFYFSLVSENYPSLIEVNFPKLIQQKPLGSKDFLDHEFEAREFNKKWKVRGNDKKLAYQIFGPHFMQLLLKLPHKYLVGIEISDQSVILSRLFDRYSLQAVRYDLDVLFEICRQIERNYRG